MRILMIGPPGAGKGTQAKRLAARFDMAHLSSGDIFRAEKASGSDLGSELARYMDAGLLVPDEAVVRVMAKAITDTHAAGGVLLDGFPRTLLQAEALDELLADADKPLDAVAIIDVDDEAVVERITGRRVAPSTGKIYHVKHMPPKVPDVCDDTGEALVQRDDDTEPVVRERLDAYRKQTAPVIDYYDGRTGLAVMRIDGNGSPDQVAEALVEAVASLGVAG